MQMWCGLSYPPAKCDTDLHISSARNREEKCALNRTAITLPLYLPSFRSQIKPKKIAGEGGGAGGPRKTTFFFSIPRRKWLSRVSQRSKGRES